MFEYKKLGDFTYNIIISSDKIKSMLLKWINAEWKIDHEQHPDQPWTLQWMDRLNRMDFSLEVIDLDDINLRPDLMEHKTDDYCFMDELLKRAEEREESMLRGISIEPLLVDKNNLELMDGYTRYMVLKKHKQKKVYAYIGTVKD